MNDSQDKRQLDLERGLQNVIDRVIVKSNSKNRYIVCDGCDLSVLGLLLNKLPERFKLISVITIPMEIPGNKFSDPKNLDSHIIMCRAVLEVL